MGHLGGWSSGRGFGGAVRGEWWVVSGVRCVRLVGMFTVVTLKLGMERLRVLLEKRKYCKKRKGSKY